MANTAIDQAAALYKALSDFFLSEASSASSSSTSPNPAEFRDYTANIDYSELLRISLNDQKGNPSFVNGSSIDTIHHAAAVIRENNMCNRSKTSYTISRSSSAGDESTFFVNRGLVIDARLKGKVR